MNKTALKRLLDMEPSHEPARAMLVGKAAPSWLRLAAEIRGDGLTEVEIRRRHRPESFYYTYEQAVERAHFVVVRGVSYITEKDWALCLKLIDDIFHYFYRKWRSFGRRLGVQIFLEDVPLPECMEWRTERLDFGDVEPGGIDVLAVRRLWQASRVTGADVAEIVQGNVEDLAALDDCYAVAELHANMTVSAFLRTVADAAKRHHAVLLAGNAPKRLDEYVKAIRRNTLFPRIPVLVAPKQRSIAA